MKTIMIYDQCGQAELQFFILDGDYSHLNGVFINKVTDKKGEKLQDELNVLVYGEDGNTLLKSYSKFPIKTAKKQVHRRRGSWLLSIKDQHEHKQSNHPETP